MAAVVGHPREAASTGHNETRDMCVWKTCGLYECVAERRCVERPCVVFLQDTACHFM